jgi:hypothetical protein
MRPDLGDGVLGLSRSLSLPWLPSKKRSSAEYFHHLGTNVFNFGSKGFRDVNVRDGCFSSPTVDTSKSGRVFRYSKQSLLENAAALELDPQVEADFFLHVMEVLSYQALQLVTAGL